MAGTYHLHTCWQVWNVQHRAAQWAAERRSSLSTDEAANGGKTSCFTGIKPACKHRQRRGRYQVTCGFRSLWPALSSKLITPAVKTHTASSVCNLSDLPRSDWSKSEAFVQSQVATQFLTSQRRSGLLDRFVDCYVVDTVDICIKNVVEQSQQIFFFFLKKHELWLSLLSPRCQQIFLG